MAAATSAKLCRYAQWRLAILDDVKREHGYANETGTVDLARLEQDKTILRAIDDAAARWREAFEKSGNHPGLCDDWFIARLTPCVYADAGGGTSTLWNYYPDPKASCSADDLRPYLAVLGQ